MTITADAHHDAVFETHLPFPGRKQGKVRDVYDLPGPAGAATGGPESLLIVATDRISAFDVVMPTPIPGKGRLLTEMAERWFRFVEERGLARTHVVSIRVGDVPGLNASERELLRGRIMIARRCRVVPVECVARGYIDGSGWTEYQKTGAICGIRLPEGLRRGDRLPEPIFTPATKEQLGKHDENIDFDRACAIAGGEVMERLRAMTLAIYKAAHDFALTRGVILADTKFEFGFPGHTDESPDRLILVDEVLTPDSSRYWPLELWKPGGEQPSFDKQYLREYLNGLVAQGQWNKQAPGPQLPTSVVEGTLARYREAKALLFGAN